MTTEQVETEALKLTSKARAEFVEEIQQLWAKEAVRRDRELDSGSATMRDAEDVLKDARSRIS